jgi:GT2 family glycosyltransferase
MTASSTTGEHVPPEVAVVILNHNGRDLLPDCLQHAEQLAYSPLHILVVDNGSEDGSVTEVERRHPTVRLLRNKENRGVAGGRNSGVDWVQSNLNADYILFLDNDTTVEPDALNELVKVAESDPRIGLVSPKAFRRKGDPTLLSAGGLHFNPYTGVLRDVADGELDSALDREPRDVQACPGFAFLARRTMLEEVGLFDECFNPYGWEDADLSLRACRQGYRIAYAPAAVVYHAGGRAGRGIIDPYERHKARNLFTFVRRHTTPFQWLCFLGLLPFRVGARVCREVLSGNGHVVKSWLDGLKQRESTSPPREQEEQS